MKKVPIPIVVPIPAWIRIWVIPIPTLLVAIPNPDPDPLKRGIVTSLVIVHVNFWTNFTSFYAVTVAVCFWTAILDAIQHNR